MIYNKDGLSAKLVDGEAVVIYIEGERVAEMTVE